MQIKFDITFGTSKKTKRGKPLEVSKAEFAKLLLPKKLSITGEQYRALSDDEKLPFKDTSWFQFGKQSELRRWPEHRSGLTIDIDNATLKTKEKIAKLYGRHLYWMYETISSTVNSPRYRLVIPFAQPIDLDQHKALATLVCYEIGLKECDVVTSAKAAQIFFLPVCFADADRDMIVLENAPDQYSLFEPTLYLEAMWNHHFEGEYTDTSTWPQTSQKAVNRAIDPNRQATDRQARPDHKPGLIGDFCRAYSIMEAIDSFLPDIWIGSKTDLTRYTYAHGSTQDGGIVYPDETGGSDDSFFYSHHGTDPYSEIQLNAFDLVRLHKFGDLDSDSQANDTTRLPSYKAMRELIGKDAKVEEIATRDAASAFGNVVDFQTASDKKKSSGSTRVEGNTELSALHDDEPEPVGDCLNPMAPAGFRLKRDPRDDGKLYSTQENVGFMVGALCCGGAVSFNERSNKVTIMRPIYRSNPEVDGGRTLVARGPDDPIMGRPIKDADYTRIGGVIEQYRDWKGGTIPLTRVESAIHAVADEFTFDPARAYFDSLPDWDGETDCGEVLHQNIAGVKGSKYVIETTRWWMQGVIARTMSPGCKIEQVLVLWGDEGKGKSQTFHDLCPRDALFKDNPKMHTGDAKAFIESISGALIVELSEMDTVSKTRAAFLKGFLSQREDVYRKSYARDEMVRPRNFMFYATSNESDWLKAEMSERRWLPVKVRGNVFSAKEHKERRDQLIATRDQLWAHALHLWREGGEVVPKLTKRMKAKQHGKTQEVMSYDLDDTMTDQCIDWLRKHPASRVSILEVMLCVFQQKGRPEHRAVKQALDAQGWRSQGSKNDPKIRSDEPGATFSYVDNHGVRIEGIGRGQRAYQRSKSSF